MPPKFIIAGKLTREYILPSQGSPLLDSPGGNLLYAAGGLALWDTNAGLLGRISDDYPQEWLDDLAERGFEIKGIRRIQKPQTIDHRSFIAYTESNERSRSSPVSHFARRELTVPKVLLGYQPVDESRKDSRKPELASPAASEVPKEYHDAGYVHLCPFDFTSQSQMVNLFKSGSNQTVSLDPSPGYMTPSFWRDLRIVLQGVLIFQPSEEELRALFWGETDDVWEMSEQVSKYGPQIIVIKRGLRGQLLYDAAGRKRYEVPVYPSRLADPTGAGDSFCGGFLAGFEKTNDPLYASIHGSVSASLMIEGSGPFYPLTVLPGLAGARLEALKEVAREI